MSKVTHIYVKFYHVHSPNMVMTQTQVANFETFQLWPNSTLNNRKSHKIFSGRILYLASYQPKTSQGVENRKPLGVGLDSRLSF